MPEGLKNNLCCCCFCSYWQCIEKGSEMFRTKKLMIKLDRMFANKNQSWFFFASKKSYKSDMKYGKSKKIVNCYKSKSLESSYMIPMYNIVFACVTFCCSMRTLRSKKSKIFLGTVIILIIGRIPKSPTFYFDDSDLSISKDTSNTHCVSKNCLIWTQKVPKEAYRYGFFF